jgi:ubiquitin carboxyl-terminal hydrolase 25/28
MPIIDALKGTAQFLDSHPVSELLEQEGISDLLAETVKYEAIQLEEELRSLRSEVIQLKRQLEDLWKDEQMAEYELTSVFIHRGSSPSWGHYFFYARNLPDKADEWFKYNDSTVSLARKEEVLADTTGSTANPYLVSKVVLDGFKL